MNTPWTTLVLKQTLWLLKLRFESINFKVAHDDDKIIINSTGLLLLKNGYLYTYEVREREWERERERERERLL